MNSPPTSPENPTCRLPQQAETITESCTSIQNPSIYYLNQDQQAECRTISTTITGNSTNSAQDHQDDDPANKTETKTNTKSTSTTFVSGGLTPNTPINSRTLNSRGTIALSPSTTHTNLNSSQSISIQPTTTTTTIIIIIIAPASFVSSSPDTLADAVPPLSLPISSSTLAPPPPLTPSSPPPPAATRQFNPAEIRPLLETIDRTALSPASLPRPPLSRIEGAETLLEIRYGRGERSRDGTLKPEPEPKLARPSSSSDKISGGGGNDIGADREGAEGRDSLGLQA